MTQELNLLVIGPPCSGKSTQSRRLADFYDLKHLSTGDLLLKNADMETPHGAPSEYLHEGKLVPDPVVNELINDELPPKDYVLDGYPRTETQAEFIIAKTELTGCLHLTAPKNSLESRVAQRRVCSKCGTSYDRAKGAKCPDCGGESYRRPDDSDQSFDRRHESYRTRIDAVMGIIERACPVVTVDAGGKREDIWLKIRTEINKL